MPDGRTFSELRFDDWALRLCPRELLHRGRRVRLQDQPLQVLEALLTQPGGVVTREQLITLLWPRRVVDYDAGLNTAVRRLRASLGDDPDSPRYIETLPRFGYRFVAAVTRWPPDTSAQAEPPRIAASTPATRPALRVGAVPIAAAAVVLGILTLAAIAEWSPPPASGQANVPLQSSVASADEHYLRAKLYFQRRAPGDLERARQHYEQALNGNPADARAWAGLAGVHWIRVADGVVPRDEGLRRLREAAERALALDPANVEAHLRLAAHAFATGDPDTARRHWEQAVALEPDHPLVLGYRVHDAIVTGREDEALDLHRRAVALDPLSVITRSNLSHHLVFARRYEEAAAESLRAASMDAATLPEAYADVLILQGRFDEALAVVGGWPASTKRSKRLAMVHTGLGDGPRAEAALADLAGACADDRCPLEVAEVHAFRGDRDAAFRLLDAVAATGRERRGTLGHLSPYLEPLHPDERWERWLAAVR
jgi:DNA-binding winged helix-turn-helix (wHTH) protein/Flp pilus assembly protein TadD